MNESLILFIIGNIKSYCYECNGIIFSLS